VSFLDDLPDLINDALGDTFRDAVLYRDAAGTGPVYDPGAPTTTTYACKAIHDQWGAFYRGNGLVSVEDRKVLVLAASLAVVPRSGDRISLEGQTFEIVSAGEGQPGVTTDPAKAVWTLRVRGGVAST
jgi:hypothetical protein